MEKLNFLWKCDFIYIQILTNNADPFDSNIWEMSIILESKPIDSRLLRMMRTIYPIRLSPEFAFTINLSLFVQDFFTKTINYSSDNSI